MKNRIFSGLSKRVPGLMVLLASILPQGLQAQGNYYDRESYRQGPYISIYEHCDFRGERRDIGVGDFASMRELNFGNDSISSIRVPRELEAIIYEHDRFKGDYTRVDRDVRCFDKTWNDEVSSLRVVNHPRGGGNWSQRPPSGHGGQGGNFGTYNPGFNHHARDGVTGFNVKQVVFDGKVLKKVSSTEWQMADPYAGTVRYTEALKNRYKVELKNKTTPQRILLDLRTNQALVNFNSNNQKTF
ncbi:MAG: beta/gamma crystallin family protein, partial [Gammaproteobacteria bacterium]|nr:beta/gamma crystallin family protein [Gammaproteobacteria bacterium]